MRALSPAALVVYLLSVTIPVSADDNPITDHNRHVYTGVTKILIAAAEKMPEQHYLFRPVETVRTFAQIVGHVADSQYFFCSKVRGEKAPATANEKKTSKAELIVALKEAFAYCQQSYDGMTDASGAARVKMMGTETPKLGALYVNQTHTIEHYGNLVTYMRIQGVVPPTSDPEFMKGLAPK